MRVQDTCTWHISYFAVLSTLKLLICASVLFATWLFHNIYAHVYIHVSFQRVENYIEVVFRNKLSCYV